MDYIRTLITAILLLAGLGASNAAGGENDMSKEKGHVSESVATFAGGCFWCIEADFEKLPGVTRAVSGYTGGDRPDPTYKEVCTGLTGHLEAVQVYFDPARITYTDLLHHFWMMIDPTDAGGQFADRGSQYRTAIFYHDEQQKKEAEMSRVELDSSGVFDSPVVTDIRPFTRFYEAEDYHQGYYRECSLQYRIYRSGSGRDRFIEKIWGGKAGKARVKDKEKALDKKDGAAPGEGPGSSPGAAPGGSRRSFSKPGDEDLRKKLDPMQFRVTQECGTEPPFMNEYWDNKREGIYVDVVSGEPLFSSTDKYESGSGWPSFVRPLVAGNVVEKKDTSHSMVRTEVRSTHGDSHLGHVFSDGPAPGGLRYCINSASLRFIPKEDLEKEGYGEYLKLFENK